MVHLDYCESTNGDLGFSSFWRRGGVSLGSSGVRWPQRVQAAGL